MRTTDGIVKNYSEAATDFPFHLTKIDADPHAVTSCYSDEGSLAYARLTSFCLS